MNGDVLPELPKGWVWTRLGEIIEPSNAKADPLKIRELPHIGLEHIEKDTGRLLGYGNSKEVRSTKTKFYSGDLLYGKLRPYLNKVSVVNFDGICSTDILVFPKNNYTSNKYIALRFLCGDFVRYASQNVSGVQHPRVNFKAVSQFSISLPPLPEQHRIVAKIEELFTRLDVGVEALKKAQAQLKRYRSSVLKAACEGKLVPTEVELTRAEGRKYEPADVLLARILKGRREKLGKGTKYREPAAPDTSGLPELPEGWCWARVGDVSEIIHYGYTASSTSEPIGPKMLRITDIQNNSVNWNTVPYCKIEPEEKHKYLLKEGDLVFARTGATVGKSFLIRERIPEVVFASYLIRIILSVHVKKEFVYNFFQSNRYWLQIREGQIGIGQPNVNSQVLSRIVLPLPPLAEQRRIVAEVERRLSVADEVEKTVERGLKQAKRLRQSVLKRAFQGKLVPQDPSDEPADRLLERIKAEKARRGIGKKARGRRKLNAPRERVLI